jgi:GT2 family glycosyltransferase
MKNQSLGVVAIGRNEGERLRSCLVSALSVTSRVVYVDSGSTDDSVEMARTLGAEVVSLNMVQPFTAARARNAGFQHLMACWTDLEYVQFVDGDCELVHEWFNHAVIFLFHHPQVVVVCGRRRERNPQRSVYNLLCDLEWDTPVGEAKACGGDALMRCAALMSAGGFREDLIAGEEPELCLRLRRAGGKVWRLDTEMTRHDAAITRFTQWWWRAVRCGHAYAEGAALHGAPPDLHWVAETRRTLIWGLAMPSAIVLGMIGFSPWLAVFILVYPAQVLRLGLRGCLPSRRSRWLQAFFWVLSRFPEALGVARYWLGRQFNQHSTLIEYK